MTTSRSNPARLLLSLGCLLVPCTASAQTEKDDVSSKRTLPPGAEEVVRPSAGELLAERSRQLDAREAELTQAAKDIEEAERRLEKKIARLEALIADRKAVEESLKATKKADRDQRIDRMTEIAGKMPPENAAPYLIELGAETAAKILEGMKSRKAAAILAAMNPSNAAEISRKYLRSGKRSRPTNAAPGPGDGRNPTGTDQAPNR